MFRGLEIIEYEIPADNIHGEGTGPHRMGQNIIFAQSGGYVQGASS